MISKEKKKEILEVLKKIIKDSQSIVFVNFHGLSVENVSLLRRKLREEEVGYKVAKKTLIKRAFEAEKIEGELPELEGEIALAYLPAEASAKEGGRDPIAPARGVYGFQKEYPDNFKIVGGVFEGAYMNQESMTEIAQIPPMQVLRGMFVNIINSPIQGFASVLHQIAEKKA